LDSCVTLASVTPAQAGVQILSGCTTPHAASACRPTGFLLARKDVEKHRFLQTPAFSFGESADLGQIENSCPSGELIVSVWF
ncbi:MAG TPA: hypothetical protein PLK00_13375, partial [Candidatus Hydrogenedentes bacterium]|nr:hypothetical protein [Candidatus Hydrogenedentota bacterium]